MRVFTIKHFFNLLIVIQICTDPPAVLGSRRRGRVPRRDQSVRNVEAGDGNRNRHFPTNSLETDDDDDDRIESLDINGLNNFSTHEEIEKSRRKRIDPKGSWLTFVNRLGENKPERRKKKRKRNRKSNDNILLGPPGPAGPPGPPGPPGSSFTKAEILKELEELIKEEVARRAQQIFADMAPFNGSSNFIPHQEMTSSVLDVPRIYAGFSLRLASKTKVERKTFKEIKSFQQPFGGGAFQRGETFNAQEGRFFAPRDGVYQFTANLHIRIRTKRKLKGRQKADEYLKVVICINSLCKTNTSIENITGVNIDNKFLTVSVSGLLHLKEKDYASLYVDNSSSYNVIVIAGSEFSGIFLGI